MRQQTVAGPGGDDGFTLVEVVVALGLVGIMAAAGLVFHMSSLSITRQDANRQVAAQLTSRVLDTARAAGGAAVLASPPAPVTVHVNRVAFDQHVSVSVCRQHVPGGACTAAAQAPGTAELARVVVSVRWSERGTRVTQSTAALIGAAAVEPVFAS